MELLMEEVSATILMLKSLVRVVGITCASLLRDSVYSINNNAFCGPQGPITFMVNGVAAYLILSLLVMFMKAQRVKHSFDMIIHLDNGLTQQLLFN